MLFDEDMYTAPLVMLSFEWRSDRMSAEESAAVAGWLMDQFLLSRCAFLASAVSRLIGRDHFVAWKHPDGQLAHSVVAVSPQFDDQLRGDALDILGRRSLKAIDLQVRKLVPTAKVLVGHPIEDSDFEQNELQTLLSLARELPWFRKLLRLGEETPDGERIRTVSRQLGWKSDDYPQSPGFRG
jgi:hypothetical protein